MLFNIYIMLAFAYFLVVFIILFRLLSLSFQFVREISQTQKLIWNNLMLGNYNLSFYVSLG